MIYAICFVPELNNRKKLTKLRAKLCKKYKSNKALQYPVHMSLTLGVRIKDYKKFEKEIRDFCKTKGSILINSKSYTSLSFNGMWSGINIIENKKIIKFRNSVQKNVNKYAIHKRERAVQLHITLVYQTDLRNMKRIELPVKKFLINRITIVKKSKKGEKYRIHKHIKLK